ncbi:MAG: hypothetical protein EXR90_06330 [Methyloglobulus sp.]|nr:hypothetical protein [Methyloglobulus sp.]
MKYLHYIAIPLMSLALLANAEAFKCKNTAGKIVYQSEPCASGAITQEVIKVKEMTLEQAEEAKVKLEAWKQQQAIDDAAKREIEKQQQTEMERQESLELQRRSVKAQEQQANSEQQRQNQGSRIYHQPYGYNGRYWNNQYYSPLINGIQAGIHSNSTMFRGLILQPVKHQPQRDHQQDKYLHPCIRSSDKLRFV